MLTTIKGRQIFLASQPIDFRMGLDGMAQLIYDATANWIHDGSIYVFYNHDKTKLKCLYWDKNGFVVFYKRLEGTKFKFKQLTENITSLTEEELMTIISGVSPSQVKRLPKTINHPKNVTALN